MTNIGVPFRKSLRWAIIPAAAALLGGIAQGQVGLGLSPMRLEFGLSSGAIQSGPLVLSNESGGPARVRAEILDFFIDDQGTPQFGPSYQAESEDSCRKWLIVNPMETEVPQRQSVTVRYTLQVPSEAPSGSYHCAVGFTTLPVLDRLNKTGLRTAVRMVAAFYAVVGHPAIEGEITKITLERVKIVDGFQWQAVVVFRNFGYKYFRASGDLAVLDANGSMLESVPFPTLPVLPKREQRFRLPLKADLAQQKYTLRARVDLGTAEVQETMVSLVPPAPDR